MGTCEDNENTTTNWALKRHSEEPELGLKWSQSTFAEEEALVLKFQNVGLKSNDSDTTTDDGGVNGSRLYPLRPYAEDCPHYLRTGTCKFELNCKFNHPLKRTNQVGKDKDNEGFSEKSEQMECKYYLTAGGCKYGKSCRFTHSKQESDISAPELNFLGLPMRLGERECPFYMRNGSCGYGARCRFHHPDPISVGGSVPRNSTLDYDNGENVPSHMFGASQPAQASWSSPTISDTNVPYLDNHLSYMPSTNLVSQGVHQNPKWSGYQVPDYSQEINRHPCSAPAVNSFIKKADMDGEEFPDRPGQPECDYFMKTGECKFKSACRYHHPKSRAPKADVCVLSDIGLPLRPGKKICRYYEGYGICKYGRACLFDHPVNPLVSSTFPDGSVLDPPPGGIACNSWNN